MDVQMGNTLTCVRPVVDHQSITGLIHPGLLRHDPCREQKLSEQRSMAIISSTDSFNHLFWNDQDVDRRSGVDIVEGDQIIVLVDNPRGDFARDDFLEDGHRRMRSEPRRDFFVAYVS